MYVCIYVCTPHTQRMEWLGHELVPFEDVLCQMLDMLKPSDKSNGLRIDDFLLPDKIRIAGKSPGFNRCSESTS